MRQATKLQAEEIQNYSSQIWLNLLNQETQDCRRIRNKNSSTEPEVTRTLL
jgi:hypothetical protein